MVKQSDDERQRIIANEVTQAKEYILKLNAGPMKHTLEKRARLEKKKNSKRR